MTFEPENLKHLKNEFDNRSFSPALSSSSFLLKQSERVKDNDEAWNMSPSSSHSSPPAPNEEGEIRCICGITEDDGFTIQCDRCLVWQHAVCVGIQKSMVPERYFCEQCQPRAMDRENARAIQEARLASLNPSGGMTVTPKKPRGRPPSKKRLLEEEGEATAVYEVVTESVVSDDVSGMVINLVPVMERLPASAPVQVRRVRSRGLSKKSNPTRFGLIAGASIDAGKFIIEFVGQMSTKESFEASVSGSVEVPQTFVFFHPLLNLVVDARYIGNVSRFIRRSCRPNAEVVVVSDQRTLHVGIYAKTSIAEGEEIFIHNDFGDGNRFFRYDCACTNPDFCLASVPQKDDEKTKKWDQESSSSDSEEIVLSPNMTDSQKQLSREERKILQYMETFQRIEERQQKKKRTKIEETPKKKRGRPRLNKESNSSKPRNLMYMGTKKAWMKLYMEQQNEMMDERNESVDEQNESIDEGNGIHELPGDGLNMQGMSFGRSVNVSRVEEMQVDFNQEHRKKEFVNQFVKKEFANQVEEITNQVVKEEFVNQMFKEEFNNQEVKEIKEDSTSNATVVTEEAKVTEDSKLLTKEVVAQDAQVVKQASADPVNQYQPTDRLEKFQDQENRSTNENHIKMEPSLPNQETKEEEIPPETPSKMKLSLSEYLEQKRLSIL